MSAVNVHTIPFLTDIGIDPIKAATMMAIMVGSGIPARLLCGIVGDRVKRRYLRFAIAGGYLMQAVGFGLYLLTRTETMIYVWFILYGIGMGIAIVLFPMIVGRYFGRKAFGSILGTKQLFQAPFSMAAPIVAGFVYDKTGTYMNVFTIFTISLVVAVCIMSFAIPPKPPAKITAIDKIV